MSKSESQPVQTVSDSQVSLVKTTQGVLREQFRMGEWSSVVSTLDSLSRLAGSEGQTELSREALGLSEILGRRGGGRHSEAGPRVAELMDGLLSRVSAWSWQLERARTTANLSKSNLVH
jgi:hypothetical protein